jgi:hypothetical protein
MNIKLFADDCIIYRKITNKKMENSQKDLETLGEWVVENEMKINPGKYKARASVKNPLDYSLCDQKFPEKISCKYLGTIIGSDLDGLDQVNYITQKAWKALQ